MEKNYLLIDIDLKGTKLNVERMDVLLKEKAFAAKKVLITGEKVYYSNILIEKSTEEIEPENLVVLDSIKNQIIRMYNQEIEEDYLKTIYSLFKNDLVLTNFCSFTILKEVNLDDFNIFYSDGSSQKATSSASYGCVQLLKEDASGELDYFSNKKFTFKEFSGFISNGTNNVGELSGVKFITENFGDQEYQLIISDSEYSLKAFREWIHNWEKNNYLTYSKKPIQNEALIKEIRKNLVDSNKIVLFKWTKGHANDTFNEKCDILAKRELGI